MKRLLVFLLVVAAALLALPPAVRAGGDEGDPKKARGKEEKKKEEKKDPKAGGERKPEEHNWEDGSCPWPDLPDVEEMMEAAKHNGEHAAAPVPQEAVQPGVGGYVKPPAVSETEAAEVVDGSFGESSRGTDTSWVDGK